MTSFEVKSHLKECPEIELKCDNCEFTLKQKDYEANPHDVSQCLANLQQKYQE